VLVMSDLHFGAFPISQFDSQLALISHRLITLRQEVLTHYDFRELLIVYLGDGPDHDSMRAGSTLTAMLGIRLAKFAIGQKGFWDHVRVEAVAANYGNPNYEENLDILTLQSLQQAADGAIPVGFDPKNPFIRRIALNDNFAGLLYHGQGLRSNVSTENRIRGWMRSHLFPFSVVMMGHDHKMEQWEVGSVHFLRTGSMIGKTEEPPRWWLFGVGNSRAQTWSYKLDLS
jgi:predicted phosphodiesterase